MPVLPVPELSSPSLPGEKLIPLSADAPAAPTSAIAPAPITEAPRRRDERTKHIGCPDKPVRMNSVVQR
jgi:hypothetical protein